MGLPQSISALNAAGIPLVYTHQNMAELWNVMTRPAERNGFGLRPEDAEAEMREIEAGMSLLPENESTYRHWRSLLVKYAVRGVQAHDTRLVATMQAHGVQHLLTFDALDFTRFSEIEAVHPAALLVQ